MDHFKRINDNYGHAAGDEVLRRLVTATEETLREHDLICRYGGEEFALLLPETDAAAAKVAAERLRCVVQELKIQVETGIVRSTISIGGAQIDVHNDSLESALSRADAALYSAKDSGRNRVCFQDPSSVPIKAAL